jgi:CheY-like chemotaxis protein
VLLVEDEEAIRRLVRRFLGSQRYHVLEARSGKSALSLAAAYAKQIDLLLSDVVMPDMGGSELAQPLLTLCPEIRIVFMSGYPEHVLQEKIRFGAGARILQKPFTKQALLESVREAITAGTQPLLLRD